MACEIREMLNYKGDKDGVIFVCNTSDWAFGPIMDSVEQAEQFIAWLEDHPHDFFGRSDCDPRSYGDKLESNWHQFLSDQEEPATEQPAAV